MLKRKKNKFNIEEDGVISYGTVSSVLTFEEYSLSRLFKQLYSPGSLTYIIPPSSVFGNYQPVPLKTNVKKTKK